MKEKYRELSFFSHRVQIKIEGYKLDRLLNKAMKGGLDIKSVQIRSDTELSCWVSPSDLKKIRKLARSLYKITVLRRNGPLPRMRRFFRSPAGVIGCVLACALVITQSLFVSAIQVNGYKGIPETELRKCLEEQGVYEGAYRPEIDWDRAEKALFDTFPEITWVQLVYSGRLVILNLSETNRDIYDGSQDEELPRYTNIVAEQSGYLESIDAYYGAAQFEAGDYVEKGDILISGCVPVEPTTFQEDDPTEYYVRAQGSVWARVPYRLTFYQERYLRGDTGDTATEKKSLEEGTSLITNKKEKTEEEVKKKAEQQIRIWTKENLPENAEIINKSLNFSYKENIIEVGVTLEVRRQIGIEEEAVIGETDSDTR